jgi:drug/metabolite transporter (DMT)-like permease
MSQPTVVLPVPPLLKELAAGRAAGVFAALVTVAVWTAWLVGTRHATAHAGLGPAWLALLRYGVPALLLAPVWWRAGLLPKGVDRRLVAGMVIGSGAPFFVVVAAALARAPAAEAGVLLPGTMPLFVALLAATVFGERIGRVRLAGFALIVASVAAIGGPALAAGTHEAAALALFPLGACLWAVFTLSFRRSGLAPLTATAVVAAWSTLLALPFALLAGFEGIAAVPIGVLAGQAVIQGITSGIIGVAAYAFAVGRIGASRAAAFSSLAPALAALAAIPVLGEIPTPLTLAGVGLAVAGVALASGAIGRR